MSGTDVGLRRATHADATLLAQLNRQLIEDEGNRNPMDQAALAARFRQRLDDGWAADLIVVEGAVAGYALYRLLDEPAGPTVELRQFYIGRAWRRRGVGRRAIALLVAQRWAAASRLKVDVLETNPSGHAFWSALGFLPYARTLEQSLEALSSDRP